MSTSVSRRREAPVDGKKTTLWARYNTLLKRHPLQMNMIQSSTITGLAQVIKQMLLDHRSVTDLDTDAVFRASFIAFFFVAPVISAWFSLLNVSGISLVPAVLLDQFVFSPSFNIYFYHVYGCLTGGVYMSSAVVNSDYEFRIVFKSGYFPPIFSYEPLWRTMAYSWVIWIPAAILRQSQVPPHLRPVFNNMCALLWQVVLASLLK